MKGDGEVEFVYVGTFQPSLITPHSLLPASHKHTTTPHNSAGQAPSVTSQSCQSIFRLAGCQEASLKQTVELKASAVGFILYMLTTSQRLLFLKMFEFRIVFIKEKAYKSKSLNLEAIHVGRLLV